MRFGCFLGVVLLAMGVFGACGGAGDIAEVDLQIRVEAARSTVKTGEGFPVTVTRTWRKDIEPSPWDDGMLSPLAVRAGETTRRENRLRIEETRTFRAHAFTLEDATIPPVLMVGRSIGGTGKLLTRSAPVDLTVVPELDPEAPGGPELPEVPEPQRPPVLLLLAGVLAAVLVALYLVRRSDRGTPAADAPAGGVPMPEAAALAALERLGQGAPERDVATLAEVLRTWLGARFHVPVRERTTAEIVHSLPVAAREEPAALLAACDLVKFADHQPSGAARDALVDRARAIVRASSLPETVQ